MLVCRHASCHETNSSDVTHPHAVPTLTIDVEVRHLRPPPCYRFGSPRPIYGRPIQYTRYMYMYVQVYYNVVCVPPPPRCHALGRQLAPFFSPGHSNIPKRRLTSICDRPMNCKDILLSTKHFPATSICSGNYQLYYSIIMKLNSNKNFLLPHCYGNFAICQDFISVLVTSAFQVNNAKCI